MLLGILLSLSNAQIRFCAKNLVQREQYTIVKMCCIPALCSSVNSLATAYNRHCAGFIQLLCSPIRCILLISPRLSFSPSSIGLSICSLWVASF